MQPNATDKSTVHFGQLGVFVICAIATGLAYTTFDPTSSDNFFLILANQTSYLKPGLVVVFFWGVLWRKTNPKAAVIVLISSPFIGFGCDWVYDHVLVNLAWVRETFGLTLNFLYRVFLIFVIGSVLIALLSVYFNRWTGQANDHDMTVPVSGISSALLRFFLLQLPPISLVFMHIITPRQASIPAAVLTFALFLWYLRREKEPVTFYQSDIFYAGILTSVMMWIMYYFA